MLISPSLIDHTECVSHKVADSKARQQSSGTRRPRRQTETTETAFAAPAAHTAPLLGGRRGEPGREYSR